MIKANELRIDNYMEYEPGITGRKRIGRVTQITKAGFTIDYNWSGKNATPIPLIPEWLEKFGFVKDEHYSRAYSCNIITYFLNGIRIIQLEGVYKLWIECSDPYYDDTYGEEIKSIHQLQNLYLDLNGQELTVNETQLS